ncbi:unnamed protein product, partial [Ectocarpus fasciculatus]
PPSVRRVRVIFRGQAQEEQEEQARQPNERRGGCRAVLVPPPSVRRVRVIFRGQAQEEQEEQEEQARQPNPTKGEGGLIIGRCREENVHYSALTPDHYRLSFPQPSTVSVQSVQRLLRCYQACDDVGRVGFVVRRHSYLLPVLKPSSAVPSLPAQVWSWNRRMLLSKTGGKPVQG